MWFVLMLALLGSVADMVGGAVPLFRRFSAAQIQTLTAIGAGFLFGATVLDRMPASFGQLPKSASLFIAAGFLLLLLLERGHAHPTDLHSHAGDPGHAMLTRDAALASFVGLLVHTFMDGVVIAGAFSINRATGILMFVAIVLHKIPEGFSMATLSLASGSSARRAFGTSAALAASTMVGAAITLAVGDIHTMVVKVGMALATGSFLYVSASDLIPAIRQHARRGVWAVTAGVIGFYLSLLFVTHVGLS